MINKEQEYERLRKEFGFIPHEHRCELKMIYGEKHKKCPYSKKQLKKESYCQCDNCDHEIYVVFTDTTHTKILFIDRVQEEYFKEHPERRETFKTKE